MTSRRSVVKGKTRVELLWGTWKGKEIFSPYSQPITTEDEERMTNQKGGEGILNRAEKGIKTYKSNSNLPLQAFPAMVTTKA